MLQAKRSAIVRQRIGRRRAPPSRFWVRSPSGWRTELRDAIRWTELDSCLANYQTVAVARRTVYEPETLTPLRRALAGEPAKSALELVEGAETGFEGYFCHTVEGVGETLLGFVDADAGDVLDEGESGRAPEPPAKVPFAQPNDTGDAVGGKRFMEMLDHVTRGPRDRGMIAETGTKQRTGESVSDLSHLAGEERPAGPHVFRQPSHSC